MSDTAQTRCTEYTLEGACTRLHLRVWAPSGASAQALPLLLMLDGQWLGTAVEQALASVSANPSIIATLGYGNHPRNTLAQWRTHDYTPDLAPPQAEPPHPVKAATGTPAHGGAARLLAILQTRVLPLLQAQHGADPARSTLFGHSLAGLFGLHVLLQAPTLFGRIEAASPSLWWRWPGMLQELNGAPLWRADTSQPHLHMAVGELERRRDHPAQPGQPRAAGFSTIPLAQEFQAQLQRRGLLSAMLEIIPGQTHGPMLLHGAAACLSRFLAAPQS